MLYRLSLLTLTRFGGMALDKTGMRAACRGKMVLAVVAACRGDTPALDSPQEQSASETEEREIAGLFLNLVHGEKFPDTVFGLAHVQRGQQHFLRIKRRDSDDEPWDIVRELAVGRLDSDQFTVLGQCEVDGEHRWDVAGLLRLAPSVTGAAEERAWIADYRN